MSREWPVDDIPESDVMPKGYYLCEVVGIEETATKNGKLMYKLQSAVLEPNEHANMQLWENFVIGTDDDPSGETAASWKRFPGRRLRQLFKACGIALSSDLDQCIAQAQGQSFVGAVDIESDEQYGDKNRITKFYPKGERQIGVTATNGAATTGAAPRRAAKASATAGEFE